MNILEEVQPRERIVHRLSKKHSVDLEGRLCIRQPSHQEQVVPSDPQAVQYQLAVTDKNYMRSSLDAHQLQKYYNKKIAVINAHNKHNSSFKHRNALRQASQQVVKTECQPSSAEKSTLAGLQYIRNIGEKSKSLSQKQQVRDNSTNMAYLSKQDMNTSISKTTNFDFRTNMTLHTEAVSPDLRQYEDIFISQTERLNAERKARIQKNYLSRMKHKIKQLEQKEQPKEEKKVVRINTQRIGAHRRFIKQVEQSNQLIDSLAHQMNSNVVYKENQQKQQEYRIKSYKEQRKLLKNRENTELSLVSHDEHSVYDVLVNRYVQIEIETGDKSRFVQKVFHDLHSLLVNRQPVDQESITQVILQNRYLRRGQAIENQLVNELKEWQPGKHWLLQESLLNEQGQS